MISKEHAGLIDGFLLAYAQNVRDILGDENPLLLRKSGTSNIKELKSIATEFAFEHFPEVKEWWDARNTHFPIKKGSKLEFSPEQRLGQIVQNRVSQFWTNLYDEYGGKKKGQTRLQARKSNQKPARRGLTGAYQRIAELYDILPPDNMVAELADCTDDGVSSARKRLRKDGYTLSEFRLEGAGESNYSWWEVTGRPSALPSIEEMTAKLPPDKEVIIRKLMAEFLGE